MNIKEAINKGISTVSNSLNDTYLNGVLKIDGHTYEIQQFKIGFFQPFDYKGEPQKETNGGQIMISVSQSLPESFYIWATQPQQFKDGIITFESKTRGTVFSVQFFKGACISFNRMINESIGLYTNFVISPDSLLINDIEHDNFWKT